MRAILTALLIIVTMGVLVTVFGPKTEYREPPVPFLEVASIGDQALRIAPYSTSRLLPGREGQMFSLWNEGVILEVEFRWWHGRDLSTCIWSDRIQTEGVYFTSTSIESVSSSYPSGYGKPRCINSRFGEIPSVGEPFSITFPVSRGNETSPVQLDGVFRLKRQSG